MTRHLGSEQGLFASGQYTFVESPRQLTLDNHAEQTRLAGPDRVRLHRSGEHVGFLVIVAALVGILLVVANRKFIRTREARERQRRLAHEKEEARLAVARETAAARAARILAAAESLRAAPGGEFFAASVLKRFDSDHAEVLCERWTAAERAMLDSETARALASAEARLGDREGYRQRYNEEFVARRTAELQGWFDGRTTKLTEEQRRAVVTDEDVTRVIAAAGSGKTSTIVAKAEYLVHQGLASPDEICLLTFNKRAAEENAERLTALGITGVTARTFHALGYDVHGQANGSKPPVSKLVDEWEMAGFLTRIFRNLLRDEGYRDKIAHWFVEKRVTAEMLDAAPTPHARLQLERMLDLRSLKRIRMRSQAEVKLADWLTLHSVEWLYEEVYPHAQNDPKFKTYQPDFFLPKHNVWIELWALTRDGRCAPTIDAAKYRTSMDWKRALHRKHETVLIEVWQDEVWNGHLDGYLRDQFSPLQIPLTPLSAADLTRLLTAEEDSVGTKLTRLIRTFLSLHRGGLWTRDELSARALSARDKVFLDVYLPILDAYEAELRRKNEIDFDDMLAGCTILLSQIRSHRFKYLLVDEFQDISRSRLNVVRQLLAVSPGSRAFLVGDDWQSINRFAGSDLGLFTNVGTTLGVTANATLGTTFRLLPDVTDVSSQFVMQNPAQFRKELRTPRAALNEPGIVLHGYDEANWIDSLAEVFQAIVARKAHGQRVLVVSRYNAPLRDRSFDALVRDVTQQGLEIEATTIHRSKGLEADHVVVLGLTANAPGFPNAMEDDPVLRMVSAVPDSHLHGEERRLMYVALTRSKGRVYVLHSVQAPSPFVEELLEQHGDRIELLGRVSTRLRCPRCKGKTIRRQVGEYGPFWSCVHFPNCEGRLEVCRNCTDGAMQPMNERISECNACKARMERCPKCQVGVLRQRQNKAKGTFFMGCSKWNSNGGCDYTRSL